MKNINRYLLGAALTAAVVPGFVSCDLDEYNPGGETADVVFETPEGMELLVNELYENFRKKFYGREDPVLQMEGGADIWQNIATNYEYGMQQTRCVNLNPDLGQFWNCWAYVYDVVNYANAIIGRVDNITYTSPAQRDDYMGEGRFMRAYCYWWLVEYFGDIDIRTEETSTPFFECYRTDRKDAYDKVIIPDAEEAVKCLPVTEWKGHKGRPTKKAAYALLARVLLTRASYEQEGSDAYNDLCNRAYQAANYVMEHKEELGIKLYDTYDDIFAAKNNKTNTEFLWTVTFSSNTSLDADSKPNRVYRYFSPALVNQAGNGSAITNSGSTWEYPSEGRLMMPTYYFMQLWEDWDARYEANFQEVFKSNAEKNNKWDMPHALYYMQPTLNGKTIKPGETALYFTRKHVDPATIATATYAIVDIDKLYHTEAVNEYGGAPVRNYKGADSLEVTQYICQSFPRFRKYRIWDGDPDGTILLAAANGQVGFGDVSVMRYAECPLIAAECQIRLGHADAAADIINKEIRNERVVAPGHTIDEAQVKASQMDIEWIMAERARELCGEWLRWFDCKRVYGPQGKFAATIRGRNPSMTGDDAMQEYHTLRPIPTKFLDKLLNAQDFGQNPGYAEYVPAQ